MKQFALIILLLLITACGTSKKAIENTEKVDEKEVVQKPETKRLKDSILMIDGPFKPKNQIKKNIDFMIKEDIAVENINLKVIVRDTIKMTKTEGITPNKSDSLGFHQELTKRTFDNLDDFWSSILNRNVSVEGNVDYVNFKKGYKGLSNYIKFLQDSIPDENSSKEEKLAYWINAYNALTIDLILRNYPVKSIKDIKDPWDQRLWKFGDKWINLNQIEHEILRKMDEPRIHFAIVCASFSCPKLQNTAYTASNLETQLTEATEQFLADENRNTITSDRLQLSKIFKWFAKDFKTDGSLIDFLNKYTEVEISAKAKKSFKDYNWDLND